MNRRLAYAAVTGLLCLFFARLFLTQASAHHSSLPNQSLNPRVLALADKAYHKAKEKGINVTTPAMAIIDYSLPSDKKRLWIVNMDTHRVIFNTLVSHGMGSGQRRATRFSNRPSTHATSIGLYQAKNTYRGRHGYSLKLIGLDKGFDDNAARREIVMHAANYVNESRAAHGQIGRSWGCPAVSPRDIRPVIDALKNGALILAYYPDRHWLTHSAFLA